LLDIARKDPEYKNNKDVLDLIPYRHALYLDFKLPDQVSIIQLILAYGVTLDKIVTDKTLISHCEESYNINTFVEHMEDATDIQDILGPERMCPPPTYKLIEYKCRDRVCKTAKDINRLPE
jgi:hypothetical protein